MRQIISIFLALSMVWLQSCGVQQEHARTPVSEVLKSREDHGNHILNARDVVNFFDGLPEKEISTDALKDSIEKIEKATEFTGKKSSKSYQLTRSIFEQWLILKLSSQSELEYMLHNYSRYLLLDPNLSKEEAIRKFDRYFSRDLFFQAPRLEQLRSQIRKAFVKTLETTGERSRMRAFLMGVIQSVVVSKQSLKRQEEYLKARFSQEDEKYVEGIASVKEVEAQFNAYYPFLRTQIFKSDVLPQAEKIANVAQQLSEEAIGGYLRDITEFLENRKNVPHFADYLSNKALTDLGEGLKLAYDRPEQVELHRLIVRAVPAALAEVRENQEFELDRIKSDVLHYPTVEKILNVNVQSAHMDESFLRWLGDRLSQSEVAWWIVEKYPFLLKGMDALNTHLHRYSRYLSQEQSKRMTALTALFVLSPIAGKKLPGAISEWLDAAHGIPGQMVRVSLVAAQLGLTSTFYFDWMAAQKNYKDTLRLSLVSLDGKGLAEDQRVFEALAASNVQKSMFMIDSVLSALMSTSLVKNRSWGSMLFPERSQFRSAIRNGWNLAPKQSPDIWMNQFKRDIRQMSLQAKLVRQKLSSAKFGPALESAGLVASHLKQFSQRLAYLGAELGFTVPGLLPSFIKTKLISFPSDVWSGVLFGTVSAVMNVTFQIYINAAAVKSLVWAFEKSGLPSPTVLRVNALDFEFRTKRDAFLSIYAELVNFKSEFRYGLTEIAMLEANLQNTSVQASPAQREQWKRLIEELRESIREKLKIHLLRWYQRTEYRSIYASCFDDLGFEVKGEPSLEDPAKLTAFIDVGGEILSYSATVEYLNSLRDRNVKTFNAADMSNEDAKNLLDKVSTLSGE